MEYVLLEGDYGVIVYCMHAHFAERRFTCFVPCEVQPFEYTSCFICFPNEDIAATMQLICIARCAICLCSIAIADTNKKRSIYACPVV